MSLNIRENPFNDNMFEMAYPQVITQHNRNGPPDIPLPLNIEDRLNRTRNNAI